MTTDQRQEACTGNTMRMASCEGAPAGPHVVPLEPSHQAQEATQALPSHHRPLFVPHGRKKGKLGQRATERLSHQLPQLGIPQTQDRATLLRLLQADPKTARLWLEIGFGNGLFLTAMAARHTQDRLIGVEVFLQGIARLLSRLEQAGLTNVRVVANNVHEVLTEMIPLASLDRVVINFPDPWPKRSHHKRRLIQAGFLTLLATRMRPGAHLHLATDWAPYATWMCDVLDSHEAFQTCVDAGHFSEEPADWVETRFQRKAQEAGRPTFHLAYVVRRIA